MIHHDITEKTKMTEY